MLVLCMQVCQLLEQLRHHSAALKFIAQSLADCDSVSEYLVSGTLMGLQARVLAAQGETGAALNTLATATARFVADAALSQQQFRSIAFINLPCVGCSYCIGDHQVADAYGLLIAPATVPCICFMHVVVSVQV